MLSSETHTHTHTHTTTHRAHATPITHQLSLSHTYAELDPHLAQKEQAVKHKELVQGIYIGLFGILGSLLRITIAQLFGEECANPGTIGWLAAAAPLCVTKDGDTTQEGGIVFSDLPTNILGSFLMGTLQGAHVLGLTVPVAVAWLSPNHPFQHMGIIHKALTTGFCGSLTTFSSWNSEMVVMIFGTGNSRHSLIWRAILGYIIGMESALGSFACGKSVAIRLHRIFNPSLGAEVDAARTKIKQGVPINRQLPDFERRFLPNLDMGENYGMLLPVNNIGSLIRWRDSTESARRVGHPLLPVLTEIETSLLVKSQPYVTEQCASIARAEGWDIDALQEWITEKGNGMDFLPSVSSTSLKPGTIPPEETIWFRLPIAAGILAMIMGALGLGVILLRANDAHTITYRTMAYSMLFAPAGAILRWKLSVWNGKYPVEGWEWLPVGTLTVNILGSLISAACVAGEFHSLSIYADGSFWTVGTMRAVKVGFAGCLTTVSTFAAEVSGYMQDNDHAYPYILTTLTLACTLSCAVYGFIVFGLSLFGE